jgi:hypothetical protein
VTALTIYGLVDPRGPELFYVGSTSQSLRKRLSTHISHGRPNTKGFNDTGRGSRKMKDRVRVILAKTAS